MNQTIEEPIYFHYHLIIISNAYLYTPISTQSPHRPENNFPFIPCHTQTKPIYQQRTTPVYTYACTQTDTHNESVVFHPETSFVCSSWYSRHALIRPTIKVLVYNWHLYTQICMLSLLQTF